MATLNVGAMAARLGLDPADFLDKMKGVQGFNGFVSGEMARQWKKTGRDGQEGLRLIDEALGIHVARPVARIVSETFPALGKALGSILPGVAFSALGFAIFESVEKVIHKVEEAREAQEKFAQSSVHSAMEVGDVLGGMERKLAELKGDKKLKFEIAGAAEAEKGIHQIAKALEETEKAAEKANAWTTKLWVGVGDTASHVAEGWTQILDALNADTVRGNTHGIHDKLFDSQEVLNMKDALKDMRMDLDIALNQDAQKGTHTALTLLNTDVQAATAYLADMTAAGDKNAMAMAAAALQYFQTSQRAEQLAQSIAKQEAANQAKKDAEEAAKKLDALYKDMASSLKKLEPESNPIAKMHAEINGFADAAVKAFVAVGNSAANALQIKGAHRALESYLALLDQVKNKLESDILAKQQAELFTKGIPGVGKETPTQGFQLANPPQGIAPTAPVIPTLGAGGTAAAEFDKFANGPTAAVDQLKMAAKAYEDALGPEQKYKLVEQELGLLLQKHLIDQNAYNAALAQAISLKSREGKTGLGGEVDNLNPGGGKMQELQQRYATLQGQLKDGTALDGSALNAGDIAAVKLAMQGITEEEDKILLKTGDVNSGIKAWADSMQQVKTAGTFVFEALTQASKGFEDDAVKSVIDVIDVQRGQHEKMIKQLRTMWSNYFNSLAEMALKHQLDKLLAPVAGKIGGVLGGGTSGAGAAPLTAAGTTLQSAGVQLIAAATALRATASTSAFSGGGALDNPTMPIPFFAAGGDATPGSSFISGEAGAEEVDLDRSGGAHITPLGGGRGGDTHQYFDQRGAVVSDDLMRKADAAALLKHAEPAFIGKALANFAEVQRRTPQR